MTGKKSSTLSVLLEEDKSTIIPDLKVWNFDKLHYYNKRDKKEIERRITDLRSTIQTWEIQYDDLADLNQELKDLRHMIIYVHMRIERALEIKITKYKLQQLKGQDRVEELILIGDQSERFKEDRFWKKVETCLKLKLLDKTQEEKIEKVNDHRKKFSHPQSYRTELLDYHIRENYLETLMDLVEAFNCLFPEIFSY